MTASIPELAGLLIATGAAALALLGNSASLRRIGLATALLAAPVLVVADVWSTERVIELRGQPALLAGGLALAIVATLGLAALLRARPIYFCVLVVAALALRVPLELGGETSNLLVPLYLVIAAQALVSIAERGRSEEREGARADALRPPAARLLVGLLGVTLVTYAVLSAYSLDVSNAIENVGFFLVPFAVLLALLLEIRWGRRELEAALVTFALSAAAFSLLALGEYFARDLLLNPELERSNEIHLYFRVNSVFFDPNVFGRYLALAVIGVAAWIAWTGPVSRARLTGLTVAALLSLVALTLSFSLTSFASLIAGLTVLAILRWRLRGALAAGAALALVLIAFVGLGGLPDSSVEDRGVDTSGRSPLVTGGFELAEARPLAGWGSGSFGRAFYENVRQARTTVSHAEPVTVAAEQGLIGVLVYVAVLVSSLAVVLPGAGSSPARAGIAAAYVAILVHSMGYAGFLIDPATWALLGVGLAMRGAAARGPERHRAPAFAGPAAAAR